MRISVYPASERFLTRRPDRVTHHSLSFGEHYDPDNVAFGPLVAHDDHHLSPGAGFDEHAHADVELVTWVLAGSLVHTDSLGNRTVLPAGTVQVQSAGSGIRHAEVADAAGPTRFVQSWLVPDEPGQPPSRFVATGLAEPGGLVAVAGSGAQVPVGVAGATLWVGTLGAGAAQAVPAGPLLHLFVATGSVRVAGLEGALRAGDAVRVSDTGDAALELQAVADSEVLIWVLPA